MHALLISIVKNVLGNSIEFCQRTIEFVRLRFTGQYSCTRVVKVDVRPGLTSKTQTSRRPRRGWSVLKSLELWSNETICHSAARESLGPLNLRFSWRPRISVVTSYCWHLWATAMLPQGPQCAHGRRSITVGSSLEATALRSYGRPP